MTGRYLPETTTTCRVCATSITVRTHPDSRGGGLVTVPRACPECTAVLKHRPSLDRGLAKGLLEAASSERDVVEYLERFTLIEREVDELLELASQLPLSSVVAARLEAAAELVRANYRAEHARCMAVARRRGSL